MDPEMIHAGGEEEHREKKSVMRKVKDKARKIKNSFKSHGPTDEVDEESDETEQVVHHPDTHAAPLNDSGAAEKFSVGQGVKSGESRGHLGHESPVRPVTYQTQVTDPLPSATTVPAFDSVSPTRDFPKGGPDVDPEQSKVNLGESHVLDHHPSATTAPSPRDYTHGQDGQDVKSKINIFEYHAPDHHPSGTTAPRYDSTASRSFAHDQDLNLGHSKGTLDDSHLTEPHPSGITAPIHNSAAHEDFAEDQEVSIGQSEFTKSENQGEDFNAPKPKHQDVSQSSAITDPGTVHNSAAHEDFAKNQEVSFGQSEFTKSENLGEDLSAPKPKHQDVSNYQSTVTDPGTGHGEEAVAPILHSFDKMNIQDEPQHGKETTETTGSHDVFPSSPTPASDFSSYEVNPNQENTPAPESFGATTETHPRDMNVDEPTTQRQPDYTDKILSVPSPIADKAISPENIDVSKIGYGGTNENVQTQEDMNIDEPTTTQYQPSYMSSVTTAIGGTPDSAKNAVASRLGYGGNNDNVETQNDRENVTSAREPIASTENLSANESAGEPAKNQTTYTEKLSAATSAFASTAVSAKDAVASKLGYGGSDGPGYGGTGYGADNTAAAMGNEVNPRDNKEKSSTVTDKVAPVYGTTAGAGSEVLSKIPGIGMGKGTGEDNAMGTPRETETGNVGETDKGVKGYIAEKLKPGEDDKALSEVISDALPKRTGSEETPQEKRAVGEVVSDAFHKRNNEEDRYGENKPMGKVTESDEVADRLGSTEEEKSGKVSGSDSPGTGMVDKFKGAFSNWFGKGEETNPSQALNDSHESQGTTGEVGNVSHEGERKLPESTK